MDEAVRPQVVTSTRALTEDQVREALQQAGAAMRCDYALIAPGLDACRHRGIESGRPLQGFAI